MKKFLELCKLLLIDFLLLLYKGVQLLIAGAQRLTKFLKNWNEFITVPIAFALFWFVRPLIRWLDPTSGVFDTGILHIFFAGLVIFLLMLGVTWLVLRLTYKFIYTYLDIQMEIDFKTLSNYQKCVLSIGFFSSLLIAFAIVLTAL